MPKTIKSVLILGSGPIVIGSGAEFDYSGTQGALALKELGLRVILINSNPATIMTDKSSADAVYIEPLTEKFVSKIIRKEKPDALLASLGGQVALNLALSLHSSGFLKENNVELLGTSAFDISRAEDRESFKQGVLKIGQSVPESVTVSCVADALDFAKKSAYPVVVRPAFTMGGSGGGFCHDEEELKRICATGLDLSPISQCLIEASICGLSEFEFELLRDAKDQVLIVCELENIDPVGTHTGDSTVISPILSLNKEQKNKLREAAKAAVREFCVIGACNVQLAYDVELDKLYFIELNPRASRSSALASKATSFPIAKVSAKLALGMTLDEIINKATGKSYLEYEPNLDYVACKMPRFAFDKFKNANRSLGTQMKSTGEVLGLGSCFQNALLKAFASLDLGFIHPWLGLSSTELKEGLKRSHDLRLIYVFCALRAGMSKEEIAQITKIRPFFIEEIEKITLLEKALELKGKSPELLQKARSYGFSTKALARIFDCALSEVEAIYEQMPLSYKSVQPKNSKNARDNSSDTFLPCFYSYFDPESGKSARINGQIPNHKASVLVLGSGPIRIAQGLEFDHSSVHAIKALKELGFDAVIINNNPATLSTDYSVATRLYYEALNCQSVLDIARVEKPLGVMVQFGGQGAINLAKELQNAGLRILGTSLDAMDLAEDRARFSKLLKELNIAQPRAASALSMDEALKASKDIGYPLMLRPSYVLGGASMRIVENDLELQSYMREALDNRPQGPILLDEYIKGRELELDAISDAKNIYIPGILEHIERSGVHSGDSVAIYPARLDEGIKAQILDQTRTLALKLGIRGLLNIQYVEKNGQVFILELNPRASRTLPLMSKIRGQELAAIAAKVIMGRSLSELGLKEELPKKMPGYYVKVPVFSFAKLGLVDSRLGPQMKSTGEVMGKDSELNKALYKGLLAAGIRMKDYGSVLFSVGDSEKDEATELAKGFLELGYSLMASPGSAAHFKAKDIAVQSLEKPDILPLLRAKAIDLVINTASSKNEQEGLAIREAAASRNIACLTSLDTARALLEVLRELSFSIKSW